MKKVMTAFIFIALFAVAANAEEGDVIFWDNNSVVFYNDNTCAGDNTCDLKKVGMWFARYRVEVEGDYNYGTSMMAFYETDSVETLEKYGFVQFIRGCMFSSYKGIDNSVIKTQDVSKAQFDTNVMFYFPNWVIDSDIKDPLYASYPGHSRLYYGQWMDNGVRNIYGRKKPTTPELFITDHPGSGFMMSGIAHNASNEFRICLYKIKDVPRETAQDNIDFAKPIKCFTWNSIFVYDHEKGIFENKNKIDPFCEGHK